MNYKQNEKINQVKESTLVVRTPYTCGCRCMDFQK